MPTLPPVEPFGHLATGLTLVVQSWHAGRECYHRKAMVQGKGKRTIAGDDRSGADEDLSEELRDAWERLRETAVAFGDQRIYASHKSIMFSRKSCYFFVRPKRNFLEVCIFLAELIKARQDRRAGS